MSTLLGSWAFLALFALAMLCVYSLAMKHLFNEEDEQDPILLSAVVFVLVGTGAAAVWVIGGGWEADLPRLVTARAAPLVALDILGYSLGSHLYFRALKVLPVSQVAVLQALVGALTLIGAVLTRVEAFSASRAAGAVLIGGATVLVAALTPSSAAASSRMPHQIAFIYIRRSTVRRYKPFALLLLAATCYAAASIADQRLVSAIGLSPADMLVVAYLPPGIVLCAARLPTVGRRALRSVLGTRLMYANALVLGAAYTAVFHAYKAGGPASGVTLILAAEVVGVVVGAAVFLRERDRLPLRLVSGTMATLGLFLAH